MHRDVVTVLALLDAAATLATDRLSFLTDSREQAFRVWELSQDIHGLRRRLEEIFDEGQG